MEPSKKQQEITALLLADIRNRKLILGLEQAGLQADNFYTGLSELIFQKMGFETLNDALYHWYEETIESLIDMDIAYFLDKQRELALKMYDALVFKRLMEG